MKTFLILALVVIMIMAWFRSGLRWNGETRGNLVALFMFGLMVAGMVGLILLAARLF